MFVPHLGWFARNTNGCQTLSAHWSDWTFALGTLHCCSVALALAVCSNFACHSLHERSVYWTNINYFSNFPWDVTFPQLLRQLEEKLAPGNVAASFRFVYEPCIYSSQIKNVEKKPPVAISCRQPWYLSLCTRNPTCRRRICCDCNTALPQAFSSHHLLVPPLCVTLIKSKLVCFSLPGTRSSWGKNCCRRPSRVEGVSQVEEFPVC